MNKIQVNVGDKFGNWTIMSTEYQREKNGYHKLYFCKCSCGTEKYVDIQNLKSGKSFSCGCLTAQSASERFSTHRSTKTKLYRIYRGIIQRCYDTNCQAYPNYGGRGITMCDEWKDNFETFKDWAYSNGYDETKTKFECSIDRIDNNGNYEPSNCRWVDNKTQCNNRRSNHLLEYHGKIQNIKQWADELGISEKTILNRIRTGIVGDNIFKVGRLQRRVLGKEDTEFNER